METNTHAFDRPLPTDEERDGFRIDDCRRVHGRLKSLAHQRAALDANEARDLVEAEELEMYQWTRIKKTRHRCGGEIFVYVETTGIGYVCSKCEDAEVL